MSNPPRWSALRSLPLHGFTIAVTARRRGEELTALVEAAGAKALHVPLLQPEPHFSDELHEQTHALIETPAEVVIPTTAYSLSAWLAAADGWGLGPRLRSALSAATVLPRGTKCAAALVAQGLPPAPEAASTTRDIVASLVTRNAVAGRRVLLVSSSESYEGLRANLEEAGAEVTVVSPYAWQQTSSPEVERVLRMASLGSLDAMLFTSRPAVSALIDQAATTSGIASLLAALRGPVIPYCIGPVTSRPLRALGIATVEPAQPRLGSLVETLSQHLPSKRSCALVAAGHNLEIQGQLVRVDGTAVDLAPAPLAVLRALAERPGHVVSRTDLRSATHADAQTDDHAIEVTVARLRQALGHARIVQTVVKRGYRLATA